MERNNIVYDLLMLEADRINMYRREEFDLYYKDRSGEFQPVGEAYSQDIENLLMGLFKKKKMRYMISFLESLDIQNEIKPSALKVLRCMCKEMNYGNILKGYGSRDIQNYTGINMHYVTKGLAELNEKDIIRFTVAKGRRTYMVNPIYFYKGSLKKIFYSIKEYGRMDAHEYLAKEDPIKNLNLFE
jgi:hypothetical protein